MLLEYFHDEETGRHGDAITNFALELCTDMFNDLVEFRNREKAKTAPAKKGPGRPRKTPLPKTPDLADCDETQLSEGEVDATQPPESN